MAPQPLTQTTASGPSTAPPTTTNPPNFTKDEKCKTAKCKLCGDKIAKYSMKCGRCTKRICSDCIDDDGNSTPEHKAIAADHLENGCWCGLPKGLNPAFKDRLPPPKKTEPVVKKQPAERKPSMSTRATRGSKKASVAEEAREPSAGYDEIAVQAPPAERRTSVSTRATRSKSKDLAAVHDAEASRQLPKAVKLDTIPELPPADVTLPKKKRTKRQRIDEPEAEDLEAPKKKQKTQAAPVDAAPPTDIAPPKRGTKRTRREEPENLEVPNKKQKLLPTLPEAGSSINTSRPKRKRSNTSEDDIEVVNPPAKKQKATRGRPAAAMPFTTRKNTIIIGAGVTGLFTAYYLAQKHVPNHKITVVDINDKEFSLASGHSAGFVTNHNVPEESDELLGESYMAWVDLMETPEFQKGVWYDQDNLVADNEDQADPVVVPWLKDSGIVEDSTTLLRLYPVQLGSWLRSRCEKLGVDFKFGCHPSALEQHQAHKLLKLNATMGGTYELVPYDRLIVTAGAWTGELVERLFDKKIDDHAKSYHWATFCSVAPIEKNVGVVLPCSSASITADRKTSTIRLTSLRPSGLGRKLLLRDAVDRPRPANLTSFAERYLSGEVKLRESGQVYVSAGEAVAERVQEGVWVAFGGGEAGLTLAPGLAKRVVRGVLEE